jgi:hypothetical protein
MDRAARAALAAAFAATLGSATAGFAGDPPKATKAVPLLPQSFVKARRHVQDLASGESSLVAADALWIAADGSGWVVPAAELLTKEDAAGTALPTVKRNADASFDVDVTGCEMLWTLKMGDGTPFVPRDGDLHVRKFIDGAAGPTDLLPGRCRGERLWSLAPGTVAYVGARRVGVDPRGQAWVHATAAVRLFPFTDSDGPAVAVTTTERDAVKLDLSGVRYRWTWSAYPRVARLKEDEGLNGHKQTPYAVTSFTVDGRVSVQMPKELMAPQVRDMRPGQAGFIDPFYARIDPNGGAWLDPDAVVTELPARDDWGFSKVKVLRVDDTTYALDLCGTTYRWCVASQIGRRFPAVLDAGNVALDQTWFKVVRVADGAEEFGAVIPSRCRALRIFEIDPGAVVYTSCRYVGVDQALSGFVGGWVPVCISPFSDELGPAAAVRIDDEQSCAVDLTGVTHRWELAPAPQMARVAKPLPGGQRVSHLKVAAFLVPAVAEPPKPPGKPPPKKK